MTDFLERMPPFLRERIHAEGWRSWRGVQEDAFRVLFDTDDHLLISAGTSSGKTEAAMIPVISSLCAEPARGVGAIYVGPTKALIDDQFSRMDRMLRDSALEVTGWHGDVSASSKESLRRDPRGILQITPESLQGVVCDRDLVRRMFPDLRFVIVDEVHAFMPSVRGLQLLCELETVERVAGCSPRRIGLSATLWDTAGAEDWLRAGTDRQVTTVTSPPDAPGRIGVKFTRVPADGDARKAAVLAYYRELLRLTDPYSCIVFTNSRASAERTARSLSRVSEAAGSRNPVRIHHGSLSASLRRDAEEDLRRGGHPTVVATSTLELGMDIGGLDRVVQIGAPYSCSSMLQRMGRTGRRGGRREMIIFCTEDGARWSPSPPGTSMDLVRAIAVSELAVREGWTEPAEPPPMPFGLLYHQTLAYLKGSDHDVTWKELRQELLSMWAFRNISGEEYRELVMHLMSIGHIQRLEDGTLVIGLKGEPIANGRGFASTFEVSEAVEVRSGGEPIGTVQGRPSEGRMVSLAGRVWRVVRAGDGWVDVVEDPEGTAESKWESVPPEVDDRVAAKMREVLESSDRYPYLDSAAAAELEATRAAYLANGYWGAEELSGGLVLYPWLGTRAFETLRRAIMCVGAKVSYYASPLWMAVSTDRTWEELRRDVESYMSANLPDDLVLLEDVEDMGKYSEFVPEGLRAREYAASRLVGKLRLGP